MQNALKVFSWYFCAILTALQHFKVILKDFKVHAIIGPIWLRNHCARLSIKRLHLVTTSSTNHNNFQVVSPLPGVGWRRLRLWLPICSQGQQVDWLWQPNQCQKEGRNDKDQVIFFWRVWLENIFITPMCTRLSGPRALGWAAPCFGVLTLRTGEEGKSANCWLLITLGDWRGRY